MGECISIRVAFFWAIWDGGWGELLQGILCIFQILWGDITIQIPHIDVLQCIPSGKLSWQQKITMLNRRTHYKLAIFNGYVCHYQRISIADVYASTSGDWLQPCQKPRIGCSSLKVRILRDFLRSRYINHHQFDSIATLIGEFRHFRFSELHTFLKPSLFQEYLKRDAYLSDQVRCRWGVSRAFPLDPASSQTSRKLMKHHPSAHVHLQGEYIFRYI